MTTTSLSPTAAAARCTTFLVAWWLVVAFVVFDAVSLLHGFAVVVPTYCYRYDNRILRAPPPLSSSFFLVAGGGGERRATRRAAAADPDVAAVVDEGGERREVVVVTDGVPADFRPLFEAIERATELRPQEADKFRIEWGTWCVESNVERLMDLVDEVRIQSGVYERFTGNRHERRLRVASSANWDVFLHCLPKDRSCRVQWPTGTWTVVKTLIGVAEIASLQGPDRDGKYKVKTTKDLRGGSDGGIASGSSSGGSDCIKYIGGAKRQYRGKAGKTVLLEILLRPPNLKYEPNEIVESLSKPLDDVFRIVQAVPEDELPKAPSAAADATKSSTTSSPQEGLSSTGTILEEVGGLDSQLRAIARRVLASRANPAAARRLGVNHVRGILLSGPPGCGKTLLARELARLLNAREPVIVNGPEILDKYIGEAEVTKETKLCTMANLDCVIRSSHTSLYCVIYHSSIRRFKAPSSGTVRPGGARVQRAR